MDYINTYPIFRQFYANCDTDYVETGTNQCNIRPRLDTVIKITISKAGLITLREEDREIATKVPMSSK